MYQHELEQHCPYCDREVEGKGIAWGADLWHPNCYKQYGDDWDELDRSRLESKSTTTNL